MQCASNKCKYLTIFSVCELIRLVVFGQWCQHVLAAPPLEIKLGTGLSNYRQIALINASVSYLCVNTYVVLIRRWCSSHDNTKPR